MLAQKKQKELKRESLLIARETKKLNLENLLIWDFSLTKNVSLRNALHTIYHHDSELERFLFSKILQNIESPIKATLTFVKDILKIKCSWQLNLSSWLSRRRTIF